MRERDEESERRARHDTRVTMMRDETLPMLPAPPRDDAAMRASASCAMRRARASGDERCDSATLLMSAMPRLFAWLRSGDVERYDVA